MRLQNLLISGGKAWCTNGESWGSEHEGDAGESVFQNSHKGKTVGKLEEGARDSGGGSSRLSLVSYIASNV